MARWEPDARGRLEAAALDLFESRGYDRTTAAQIAERVGLTERTFFRHFGDKREVLFANQDALEAALVEAVRDAPAELGPDGAIAAGFRAMSERLAPRRELLVRRARLIAAHPELRERELAKLAAHGTALAGALAARGVPEPDARLAGEVAITVFRIAFERWIVGDRSFPDVADEALGQLGAAFRTGAPA